MWAAHLLAVCHCQPGGAIVAEWHELQGRGRGRHGVCGLGARVGGAHDSERHCMPGHLRPRLGASSLGPAQRGGRAANAPAQPRLERAPGNPAAQELIQQAANRLCKVCRADQAGVRLGGWVGAAGRWGGPPGSESPRAAASGRAEAGAVLRRPRQARPPQPGALGASSCCAGSGTASESSQLPPAPGRASSRSRRRCAPQPVLPLRAAAPALHPTTWAARPPPPTPTPPTQPLPPYTHTHTPPPHHSPE